VALIGATTTSKGLRVEATLDERPYPRGESVPTYVMELSSLLSETNFTGEWNYQLKTANQGANRASSSSSATRQSRHALEGDHRGSKSRAV
jgi:hypothetical protein